MIRINLLPIRQARKLEAARRELSLIVAGGLFVLFAAAGAYALALGQKSSVQAQNAELQTDIDRLSADVKKVDEMEKFKGELETKLAVIDELRDKKNGPVHMLDELGMATPDRLQLSSVTEKAGNLDITGLSVSNEIISQFLRSLDASPYFDSVYLKDIEVRPQDKDAPIPVKEFKVTARLVTPKVEDQATAPTTGSAAGDIMAIPPTDGTVPADGTAPPADGTAPPATPGTDAAPPSGSTTLPLGGGQ